MSEKKFPRPRNILKYYLVIFLFFVSFPLAVILFGRKKTWVICERGFEAQDNGFFFYKFLREHKTALRGIRPIYLISKNSPDLSKVARMGETIYYHSAKHWLALCASKVKISTHVHGYCPWAYLDCFFRRHTFGNVYVFLQHGITKDNLPDLYFRNTNLTLFICGSLQEYAYVTKLYGYPKSNVRCLGLARYDYLQRHVSTDKKTILVMPTWRRYLSNTEEKDFLHSDFYKCWSTFLEDDRLCSLLESHNLQIAFYMHFSSLRFEHLFQLRNASILICDFKNSNLSDLICQSEMLITDFSSVSFDFAYLKKPVVYYQFDTAKYKKLHYSSGYFNYRRDGFGEVVDSVGSLIRILDEYVANGFHPSAIYLSRSASIFAHRDTKNCERICQSIIEIAGSSSAEATTVS